MFFSFKDLCNNILFLVIWKISSMSVWIIILFVRTNFITNWQVAEKKSFPAFYLTTLTSECSGIHYYHYLKSVIPDIAVFTLVKKWLWLLLYSDLINLKLYSNRYFIQILSELSPILPSKIRQSIPLNWKCMPGICIVWRPSSSPW